MRALLVVDEPSFRNHLESVFARRGWEVAFVTDLAGFAAAVRREGADIVVVEEDRTERAVAICRELRAIRSGPAIYLLALVWHHDSRAIGRLVAAGVDDVIGAPADPVEIGTRLVLAEARLGRQGPRATGGVVDVWAELLEMRQRMHVQQAFLEGIFESAPEGVVILDQDDRVARINGEFTRVFGYTPDEAIGRPLNDLIVPEDLRFEGVELDGGVRRGERVMVETVRRHKDGHLIDVSVLATHIDVNGPAGAFGIYRDITERKVQEAALRESEARYRALFDQAPVGVFLCDRDLRITHCNEYLTGLFRMPYEEIVGSDLRGLRNSRLLPGLRAALGGEPAFYEGPYRARGGKQLHVSVQYAPLRDEAGEVIGGIGVLEDISHRVLTEKQLRAQAAEMERVNSALRERTLELEAAMKARSRLYSAMNHELRTPISAVMLYQELLISGTLGPLLEDQRRALEHSHTATSHLLDLVRDILDLSKIEAGKVSVQPAEVCVRTLLSELHASMAPLTEHYGSALSIEIASAPDRIVTDPQRLRQVLMNFVSNAAKYGRKNPIVIRSGAVGPREMFIEVVDRGIGIASDDVAHIFEDFVQLGAEKEEGTGLGLAISRRLADLLGARLEVESELGSGSSFRIVLPAEHLTPAEQVGV
jgi:PAS domain S-box-containing protein